MPGIEHDALSDIQNIRRLLDVYQPGFAFLKELIQNADDAEASRLLLRWSPGIPGAEHPLLQGPALVSINDGEFTTEDKHSLLRMGLGNKGGNSGKIGKFGLGTKSIFHVAEAFIFLESSGHPELRDILNPWSPRSHKNWDTVSAADWGHLEEQCAQIADGLESWFALWIPLRRKQHLEKITPIRKGTGAFPGESSHCPPELLEPLHRQDPRLGLVLPMLHHLERVDFDDGAGTEHNFVIDRKCGVITHNEIATKYRIGESSDPNLAEQWRDLPAWPQVFRIQENGEEEVLPDKAEWSHAIILTITPTKKSEARFRIYWSVFLPVGNEAYLDVRLPNATRDISLFFHGFFFLNDSRTQIKGLDRHFPAGDIEDANGVCLEWNRELACNDDGLLPTVLPQIEQWFKDGHLQQGELPQLTEALIGSSLWQELGDSLTRQGSLLYCLLDGAWGWHWIPKSTPATYVPEIGDASSLDILKKLTESVDTSLEIVFAVDLAGHRSLSCDLRPFDTACLAQLRGIIGNRSLDDDQAGLIARILRSTLGQRELPAEWRDVPLYRVRSHGTGNWTRISSNDFKALVETKDVFATDPDGLAKSMGLAAGTPDYPYLAGHELPPHLQTTNLTVERAAAWILARPTLANDPKERLSIFKHLATRERFSDLEIQALRYLAHAQAKQCENTESPLFFRSGGAGQGWNLAFDAVLDTPEHSWRLIDPRFGKPLTESLKRRTSIDSCSRETWPGLIESLGGGRQTTRLFPHRNGRHRMDPGGDPRGQSGLPGTAQDSSLQPDRNGRCW